MCLRCGFLNNNPETRIWEVIPRSMIDGAVRQKERKLVTTAGHWRL